MHLPPLLPETGKTGVAALAFVPCSRRGWSWVWRLSLLCLLTAAPRLVAAAPRLVAALLEEMPAERVSGPLGSEPVVLRPPSHARLLPTGQDERQATSDAAMLELTEPAQTEEEEDPCPRPPEPTDTEELPAWLKSLIETGAGPLGTCGNP